MKTVVYLVRHGDVENPEKILYERMNGFPLSELGRNQAHELGRYLSGKRITALYASPLERTRETAGILASYQQDLPVFYDERLLEVSTPARGMKFEVLMKDRWNWYKRSHIKAGGERLGDIWIRMERFFHEVIRKHEGQELVAVSHGDPIMISMVKHKGRRLTLDAIRSEEYVGTARGFRMVFEGLRPVDVSKLAF